MTPILASAAVPLLRLAGAERAHGLALRALALGLAGTDSGPDDPRLAVRALGLDLPNPIGLAAGFDKNAEAIGPLARLGFGFVEAGTVTPLPQAGNPRPRVFRLAADRAIINRLGFNNAGIEAFRGRMAARRPGRCAIGANVGINKDHADPERDYPALVAAVSPVADYVTINVSSPNTPGLRDLQSEHRLRAILAAIARGPAHPPLLVKIAPDLAMESLATIVEACVDGGAAGLIVSNTTIARPAGLQSRHAGQAGGLSGPPLRQAATRMLARAARLARGRLVLVGVGGISSGRDVLEKLRAGATLVQLYSAFAYDGPALIPRLKRELADALAASGFGGIAAAIGTGIDGLADDHLADRR